MFSGDIEKEQWYDIVTTTKKSIKESLVKECVYIK